MRRLEPTASQRFIPDRLALADGTMGATAATDEEALITAVMRVKLDGAETAAVRASDRFSF